MAGLGNSLLFEQQGLINYQDMDWGDKIHINGSTITFVQAQHRSGRGLFDQAKTLWGGYVVESKLGNIYFAGDTGYGRHFKQANKRFGAFRLSIIPIGSYEPRDFMATVHLNPAESVKAHLDLKSQQSVGAHFGTFPLALEDYTQPVKDLHTALDNQNIAKDRFWVLQAGETRQVPVN